VFTVESCREELKSQDGDGDGEECMSSKPRPVWLETLLCKYTSEVINRSSLGAGAEAGAEGAQVKPSTTLPPVGSLCAFLSCCAIKQVAMTKSEEGALLEVPALACLHT
jgi:hypothetical protein